MMKKFVNKALAGALSFAMVLGSAVMNPEVADAKKVTVKKVSVSAPSGKTAYVAKGKKITLTSTVKVTPNKSANKKVTYKSANTKVASVNSKGQVKGVKAGSTKVTVTSKKNSKKKATIKVVVKKAAVKKVTMKTKTATLAVGGKTTLKTTVTPKKNTCTKVVWTTSKKKVATVTSKGVVKGVAEGTATITAKAADGSGKKATCKVTVGAGIANVTVPTSKIVRVQLTSAKALNKADFTIQNKWTPTGSYQTSEGIEKVESRDGGKTYDITLDDSSRIYSYSYVKVSIPALKIDNTKEVFIENIEGYSDASTEQVTIVTGKQNGIYSSSWYIDNSQSVGDVKYSVSGLPSGLKAYIGKNGSSVSIKGRFANVENGTTATLTGVDEKGKTFTKKYMFYVGNDTTIVGKVLDQTVLSYIPANTSTNESASGYSFNDYLMDEWGNVIGGSGNYRYAVTGLPANVTMDEYGYMSIGNDANGNRLPVAAGTYPITLTVADANNAAISTTLNFTLNIVEGVTLTGTVKDASGVPVEDIEVNGYTKEDAYGRSHSFWSYTDENGKYKVRVLPGDYYQYIYYDTTYDNSIGNVYTSGTVTKDFTLPLHRVTFTANVPGAGAFSCYGSVYFYDTYGVSTYAGSYKGVMYAYMAPGTYETSPAADTDDNWVTAYTKYNTEYVSGEGSGYINSLGHYAVSGSFTVTGNMTVTLNATPVTVSEE